MGQIRDIELLAPARDVASARDAVDCGADAVYMGAAKFGARYAATNSVEDIAAVAEYAHQYGVKLYVTLNTLLFDSELSEAESLAHAVVAAGADALIVQDMAYCRMGLGVPLHASTQTNCTEPQRVKFFEQTGFARAILERSLSLAEIRQIRRETNIELESFVHGAICVCQSGRCFLSRSMGNRSGNRGECSQPCRQTYDLVDESDRIIIKGKHLLSARDLNLSKRLGELIDAGVSSFKIEGRLKDRTYIRNTVSLYRRLLDEQIALRSDSCRRQSWGSSVIEFTPDARKSFTRDGTEYFLDGKRRGVASFDTPKAMGERLGRVVRVTRSVFNLDSEIHIEAGDGLCFFANGCLMGTNVNRVSGGEIEPNRMDGIVIGTEIYRNFDHNFSTVVEHSRLRRSIDCRLEVVFRNDEVEATATDEQGISVTVRECCSTSEPNNVEKMIDFVRTQLSKSGATPFRVTEVSVVGGVRFVPSSALASLRRKVLEALRQKRLRNMPKGAPFVENMGATYPDATLLPQDNVTNRLAREFYLSHGVNEIATGLDCCDTTAGERVMISDYCLRREIGECLREGSEIKGDLYLCRGRKRYRLGFDCNACRMSLIDVENK